MMTFVVLKEFERGFHIKPFRYEVYTLTIYWNGSLWLKLSTSRRKESQIKAMKEGNRRYRRLMSLFTTEVIDNGKMV